MPRIYTNLTHHFKKNEHDQAMEAEGIIFMYF